MKQIVIDKSSNELLTLPKENDLEIIIKKNVEVSLLEESNETSNINVILEENSVVTYLSIDLSNESNKSITIKNNASLNIISADFCGGNKKLNVNLDEENANFYSRSIIMVKDSNSDTFMNVYHNEKNTFSKIENYITANQATVNVDVVGKIEKGKSSSNCSQKSRGIIVSDGSSIKVQPVLLIDEFDVMANHGASIGKIDEEGLYYLMSRGISKHEAEALIIRGFLGPILKEIKDEKIREKIVNLSNERL